MGWSYTPEGFSATAVSLATLIMLAFPREISTLHAIRNEPDWTQNERYDLLAKVAPEDVELWTKSSKSLLDKPLVESMLQAVLADRCKLAFHRVPGEFPARALVVDKHGTTLKPANAAAPPIEDGMTFAGGGHAKYTGKDRDHLEWTFRNATMDDMIYMLSTSGDVIRNQTNLTGRYDFVLTQEPFDPPDSTPGLPAPPRPANVWDIKPLGLRLDPIKITIQTVIIDHIERPTEN